MSDKLKAALEYVELAREQLLHDNTSGRLRRALVLIGTLEWSYLVAHPVYPYMACPICKRSRDTGHKEDCSLGNSVESLKKT